MKRLVILPDEALEPMAGQLRFRLESIAREVSAENLPDLVDSLSSGLLVNASKPHSPMLWALADKHHSLVWGSEDSREIVLRATADTREGLIAMVFDSGRAAFLREPELRADAWTNLPRLRDHSIEAMAAVPVRLAGRVVGVLSLVGPGVEESDVGRLALASEVFSRLAESRILRDCLGLDR